MKHCSIAVDGIDTFYRDAGPEGAPVLLLPHGYPGSSFVYRHLMSALADEFRLIAPDLPGFGYSATPPREQFAYTFDAYASFLVTFADELGLERYALWLHDYGSQLGLRLAMERPERVSGLIIANGDIYEDEFGPKYDKLREVWATPGPAARRVLEEHVSLDGFRDEFSGGLPPELARQVSPDLWTLHWALLNTPERRANLITLLEDQPSTLGWFKKQQAWLRETQPPTLILWGQRDGYMPASAATAYLRDLPAAETHIFDGGHWLLETHLDSVVPLTRSFLRRLVVPADQQRPER
jgi:pimeloyl-ACP methyl ester carboxylesterase